MMRRSAGSKAPFGKGRRPWIVPGMLKLDLLAIRFKAKTGQTIGVSPLPTDAATGQSADLVVTATTPCVVFDGKGAKVAVGTRSWFAHEVGPIPPKFSGTKEVDVRLSGASGTSAQCSATEQPQ